MFVDSQSTLHAQPVSLDTPLEPLGAPSGLREIAQRYKVCYEVWPGWSIAEGRKLQIGFELQLCGVNPDTDKDGIHRHPVPGCWHCFTTYQQLRQLAEWILPQEERPSRYAIQAFDHALHTAPRKRQRRSEVVVTIVIMHRRDFNRPVDGCESRCLKEMRAKLAELGIREGIWREEEGLEQFVKSENGFVSSGTAVMVSVTERE